MSFSQEVRPILSDRCFACHGPDEAAREADLRLDVREEAVRLVDGDRRVIDPGRPEESLLMERILHRDPAERMPPPSSKQSLTSGEKEILRKWIEEGAVYEEHWAFQSVLRPRLPSVEEVGSGSSGNGIDAFIEARLAEEGMEAEPRADRYTQIRRLYVDMLGVTPAVEDVEAFVRDGDPAAYLRLVDRVLASPHLGERWGRHWLDQARYADSDGYAPDGDRSMWPYRDWVIAALNADQPFDAFTVEQLAGDLLEEPSRQQLVATGFHRNTLINTEGGTDPEQFRHEAVVDRTNTTGAVWMGLTLGCAQCHTHKFDPIEHREYYAFFAFFNNDQDRNGREPVLRLYTEDEERALGEARERLLALEAGDEVDDEKRQAIEAVKGEIREVERGAASTMIMGEREEMRPSHVHLRGDFLRPGERVEPGVLQWLLAWEGEGAANRLDLARWLVDPRHPLTARVLVNRLWMHHFGRGLVETENDFGLQGSLPTHPGLLDWLADECVEGGWSLKRMHRLMVTSEAYRRSSRVTPSLRERDPGNRLWARQSRPRVEAEVVRDLALAASGLWSRRVGGPSVYPPQPDGIYAFTQNKKSWRESQGGARYRRGMYTFFYRSAPHPLLSTFDTPNFQTLCTRRERSNTPLQALQVANDPMFIEFARGLAGLALEGGGALEDRVVMAFRRCLARVPEPDELGVLAAFWERQVEAYRSEPAAATALAGPLAERYGPAEAAAWTALARVLLNLDEFITRG